MPNTVIRMTQETNGETIPWLLGDEQRLVVLEYERRPA